VKIRFLSTFLAAASFAVAISAPAAAQDYPTKPVRIVVPFSPGGLNDIAARLFAQHLSERLGKQFVVENRTGAGGVVGSELVANAPKDGYTLLIASIAHAVNPSLYKLPYDSIKAFTPVGMFVSSPNALAVNPELPAKNVQEFVALAKAKPGGTHYASGGIGGSLHLGYELFKLTAGIDVVHVPFKGAGPAVIDVAGGHSQSIIATITTLIPHHKTSKLRLLGVSGTKRSAIMPELPTIEEQGVKGYEAGNWIGLVAPAGTPPAVIEKLNKEIAAIQKLPDVQKRMTDNGADLVTMTSAEFGKYMESELGKWGKVVKQAGIKPQ
jgi:tripartite-type tricarboxylate transporter receptor subunit TctC